MRRVGRGAEYATNDLDCLLALSGSPRGQCIQVRAIGDTRTARYSLVRDGDAGKEDEEHAAAHSCLSSTDHYTSGNDLIDTEKILYDRWNTIGLVMLDDATRSVLVTDPY